MNGRGIAAFAMFPLIIASSSVTAAHVAPKGYEFISDPAALVQIPFAGFQSRESSEAILLDGITTGNSSHSWSRVNKRAVIRIAFDFGGQVRLSRLEIHRGDTPRAFRAGSHGIRLLGKQEKGSYGAYSVLATTIWKQESEPTAVVDLPDVVVRSVELEFYVPKKRRDLQISEVVFQGERIGDDNETSSIPPQRPWVDCFGQYTREAWDGKISSKNQLAMQGKKDVGSIDQIPPLPYPHDQYGGLAGSKEEFGLTGSGFFRVSKVNGKWWFVTPEGNLFFALGMDSVLNPGRSKMLAHHREAYTSSCPPKTGNFYIENLKAKFGQNYIESWLRVSLHRISKWNFNTLGKWSTRAAWDEGKAVKSMPYTVVLRLGKDVKMVPLTDRGHAIPDVFEDDFEKNLSGFLGNEINVKGLKADPWFLGYMINNEEILDWKLVRDIMALEGSDWAIKRKLVKWLQQRYDGRLRQLNRSWGLDSSTFAALQRPQSLRRPHAKARREMETFVGVVAERYFRILSETLKRIDPNHLYLGNNMGWLWSDAAVKAYGRHVDVASFDHYTARFDAAFFDHLANLTDRPILVGEHGISVPGRGLRVNVNGRDQVTRARLYEDYIKDLAQRPYMVGNFYFMIKNQEVGGNHGKFIKSVANGFIDITDQEDKVMGEVAADVHARIYEIRKP